MEVDVGGYSSINAASASSVFVLDPIAIYVSEIRKLKIVDGLETYE